MPATATRSTEYPSVSVAEPTLPAPSVVITLASITLSGSATKSAPGTSIEKSPLTSTVPVNVLLLTVRVTVSPVLNSPPTVPVIGMF